MADKNLNPGGRLVLGQAAQVCHRDVSLIMRRKKLRCFACTLHVLDHVHHQKRLVTPYLEHLTAGLTERKLSRTVPSELYQPLG